jgi:peptide/nickel transport system permease protein
MGRYLVRRTLFMLLVLWIISVLTFLIFVKLPPGDPAVRIAGKARTPENVAQIRKNLGLDQPIWVQYSRFAKGLIPLPGFWLDEKVYYSWGNKQAVKSEIAERLPVTAVLTAGAAILWLLMGIPIGIISAVKRRSVADRAGMLFALLGVSAPTFWLGLIFLYVFFYKLGWAPPSGIEIGQGLWDSIISGKYILAWLTLSITSAAFYTRVVRGNMLEVLSEDYIRTARAKGISERKVTYRHALRASLTPVVTMLGLDIAGLLGGAVITEKVFSLPGIGAYAIDSLDALDFPPVMGVTILAAVFIVVANLVVDVVYAFLDPRVRFT